MPRIQEAPTRAVADAMDAESDLPESSGGRLPIDMYETPDAYIVRAMLPGVTPENLAVCCHDHGVMLVALITPCLPPTGDAAIWRIHELGSGPFVRSVELDIPVDPVRIERRLADGVLTLRLPKRK